jgi:anti-sigma regulatory factor (Ser/Thr protein kinase)
VGTLSPQQLARYQVRSDEDAAAARQAAGSLAAQAGGLARGQVETAVTALASNLVRHAAGGGYLLCQAGHGWLEIISADRGPGLPPGELPAAGAPGPPPQLPATGQRPGAGLAAVRRLAQGFDWYTGRSGTVILARFGTPERSLPGLARWGAVNVPLGGTGPSGDAWAVTAAGQLTALVVDGLGHGPRAAAASAAALAAAAGEPVTDPAEFMPRAHQAMHGTRGGVIGVSVIDPGRHELAFAGVGNIAGWLLDGTGSHGLISREGTVGTELPLPVPPVSCLPWQPGSVLILASDGIRRHWDPLGYPMLLERDPSVIAAVLYRDHERGTDDATVLVVQDARGAARER